MGVCVGVYRGVCLLLDGTHGARMRFPPRTGRCLLKNPAVVVLDEATSALDNRTEKEVQTALGCLKGLHPFPPIQDDG